MESIITMFKYILLKNKDNAVYMSGFHKWKIETCVPLNNILSLRLYNLKHFHIKNWTFLDPKINNKIL